MAPKQKHSKKGKGCGISLGKGCGNLISIRSTTASLSVFCIAASATVCTLLADMSARKGISNTKKAGDDGIGKCWDTAGNSTDTLTNLILDQVGKQITEHAQEYTDRPRRIVKEITQWMAAMDVAQTLDYEWQRDSLQPHMWNNLWDEMPKGLTTIGSMTTKGQFVMLFEPPDTVQLPYDKFNLQKQWTTLPEGVSYNDWGKYHEVQLVVNNGSDYGPVCNGDNYDDDGRAQECRTWYGAAEPQTGDFRKALTDLDADRLGLPGLTPTYPHGTARYGPTTTGTNESGVNGSDIYEPCDVRFVGGEDASMSSGLPGGPLHSHTALHGARYPRNACPSQWAWDPLGKIGGTNYWKKALDMPAPGPNRVSSPRTLSTSLWASSMQVVMSTWTHPGADAALFEQAPQPGHPILGTVWAGADLRHVSFFLQSVKVDGADLRLYIAQASDWEMLADPVKGRADLSEAATQQRGRGTLVGASHGPVRVPVCTTESICRGEQTGRMRFEMRFLKDVEAADPVIRSIANEAARLGSDKDYTKKRSDELKQELPAWALEEVKADPQTEPLKQVQAFETCCRGGPSHKMHKLGHAGGDLTLRGGECITHSPSQGGVCLKNPTFTDGGCRLDNTNGYNDDALTRVPCSPEWPTTNASQTVDVDLSGGERSSLTWSNGNGETVFDGYATMAQAWPKRYVEVMVDVSECVDDPQGLLSPVQMTCEMAALFCKDTNDQSYSGQYCCDFDMSKGPGWYQNNETMPTTAGSVGTDRAPWEFPESMTIGDICPQTCNRCPQQGGAPAREEAYLARAMRHDDGYGLDWWVVMAVDRKYVYGEIDTQTAYTRGNITEANRRVEGKRTDDQSFLALWIACISTALIAFSVAFAYFIVRPVNKLQNQMRCVAQMELEKVDTREPPSILHEVKRMQRDFKKMVQCIRKYREFLPMSVLEEVTGRNEEGAAEAEEAARQMEVPDGSQVSSQQRSAKSASGGGSAMSRTKGTSHSSQSFSLGSSMSQGSQLATVSKALTKGVTKKKVTFLALGFKGWHAHFQKISDSDMLAAHTGLLSSMLEKFNQNKGVPDAFCGDRVMASFNAVKPVATHKVASCTGALALLDMSDACSKDGLDGLRDEGQKKGKNTTGLPQISLALASGDAKVGNMGCDGMKKYAHMSLVVTFAYALERHANRLAAGCLLDKAVHCDVENNFTLREAGTVLLLKRGQKPCEVHQLAGRKEASEDEWMYQLEEQNKHQDEFFHWKAVVKAVKEELWDEATGSLQAATPADAPDAPEGGPAAARRAGVLAQLREAVAAQAQIPPADASSWH